MTSADKFWSKVDKLDGDGCWLWTGRLAPHDSGAYGVVDGFIVDGKRYSSAHRVSWALEHGDPGKSCVIHECPNNHCVRPSHLFLGTRSEVATNRHRKGHTAKGAESGNWRGGRSVDADGYVWIHVPDHPMAHGGKYLEHRVVMERKIGRLLTTDEHVHHKNERRDDNRLSNLEILSSRDHAIEHRLGTAGKGRKLSDETKLLIASAHLGKPKASRGRQKVGRDLEASRKNIIKARDVRAARGKK